MMARLRGNILLNEQVVYADLDIFLHESRRGMYKHRNGCFLIPVGEEPALGEEFTLKLSDGRSLQIITKRLKPPDLRGGPSKIEFIGTGPIKT